MRYRARMRRLALFARPPEIGKVKTRLSPALPPAAAAALYGGMLEDAIEALRGSRAAEESFLYWAGSEVTLLTRGVESQVQSGESLGERLASAFQSLLVLAGDRGVIFGADCPALDAAVIDAAFARLESVDLVLVPARDGGYALIGLSRPAEPLFRDVAWSTDRVLAQTLERAGQLSLTHALLDPLDDVDTPEDLCRLLAAAVVPDTRVGANTRMALGRLGMLPAALTRAKAAAR